MAGVRLIKRMAVAEENAVFPFDGFTSNSADALDQHDVLVTKHDEVAICD